MPDRARPRMWLAGMAALAGCASPPSFAETTLRELPAAGAKPSKAPVQSGRTPPPGTGSGGGGGGQASPGPTGASPAASPTPGAGYSSAVGYSAADRILFHSNQGAFGLGLGAPLDRPGNQNSDVFMYTPLSAQVVALPGVNTAAPESNARISDDGRWLVFQRTSFEQGTPHQALWLFDTRSQTLDDLPSLNGETTDAYMPDISRDGTWLVYVRRSGSGTPELRLFNTRTRVNTALPVANVGLRDVTWPSISGDGQRIAFGGSTVPPLGSAHDLGGEPAGGGAVSGLPVSLLSSDIYVYSRAGGGQPSRISLPTVNTAAGEYNPELSCDGRYMLFVSDRLGQEDIYEADLQNNTVDNLTLLNNVPNIQLGHGLQPDFAFFPLADKQQPRYLGDGHDRIVFQIKPAGVVFGSATPTPTPAAPAPEGAEASAPSPSASPTPSPQPVLPFYPVQLRVYDRSNGQTDMLSAVNSLLFSSATRAPQSELWF